MKHIGRLLAGLLPLVVMPALARAQAEPALSVSFGIGGGLSVPVRATKDAFQNGFNGDAFVRLDFGRLPLSVRADVTYQSFDLQPLAVGTGTTTGGTGTLLGGLGCAQVYVFSGHVRPYLLAGLGAYNVKVEPGGAATVQSNDTRFAVDGGAGLLFTFGSLSLYAEGRLDRVFTEKGLLPTDRLDVLPVSCGVIF